MTLEECGMLVVADSTYDDGLDYFFSNGSTYCKSCTRPDTLTNISSSSSGNAPRGERGLNF